MVVIGRSLLIFSDVTFKMAVWRPYWIFWYPDCIFSLALNINSNLQWHKYLCTWVGAYWFSATLFSKWPPGGHIGFFGFWTLTLLWLWVSTWNFSGIILMYMGRSLLIFSNVIFKMAAWRPYWIFYVSGLSRWHGFWSVSQVCFGISISNFIFLLMVVIGRSLLIFNDVTFKMAIWWPF